MIKTKQYEHQKVTHERTKDKRQWMYLFEQGLGKTKTTIDCAASLYCSGSISGVLVVAPNGVHEQWISKELVPHCGVDYDARYWIPSAKIGKRKLAAFEAWLEDHRIQEAGPLRWFTINIEALRTDKGYQAAYKFLKYQKCMMVVDEVTVVKNQKAIQSKRVYQLAALAEYRRALTGTPINNSPLDLWGISKFLGRECLPYPTWTAFKCEFAIEQRMTLGLRSFNKVVGYRNLDKLSSILKTFSTRYEKKDCLDLPEKIFQQRFVYMSPEQERVYKVMKEEMMVLVQDKMVAVTTVLAALMKLQQVVSGFIKQTDSSTVMDLPNGRLAALDALYDEIQDKVIIWCCFKHNVKQIAEHFRGKYGADSLVTYFSEDSLASRAIAVDRLNDDPTCKFFVATNAASKGLTLTGASHAIYYSRNYKLEDRLQSIDRIHRIGQDKTCVYHDLVTPGTVDEAILKRLDEKEALATLVLDKIKEMI